MQNVIGDSFSSQSTPGQGNTIVLPLSRLQFPQRIESRFVAGMRTLPILAKLRMEKLSRNRRRSCTASSGLCEEEQTVMDAIQ